MARWILTGAAVVAVIAAIAAVIGHTRDNADVDRMTGTLLDRVSGSDAGSVDFDTFSDLPPPVARYLKKVLAEDQKLIRTARMRQSGELRTDPAKDTWSSFTSRQVVVPPATGFIWDARVKMPLGAHVRVVDSYSSGTGSGRVSLMSAFTIASDTGAPELDSGALHRYLAEAVWYPTALLPQSGVAWSPIDDRSATATLTDGHNTVSLEFRFNEDDEVAAIFSPGRYGRFDGEYRQVPWEGHFRDYRTTGGVRIPGYGEVGWYVDGTLQLVWKGSILDIQYR